MRVHTTDNTGQVEQEILLKASLFLRVIADEIVKISEPHTPKKSGRLRMDTNRSVQGLHGRVKWGKNYAIYQETKQFKNYTTPGTGPHYAENAVKEAVKQTGWIARKVGLAG